MERYGLRSDYMIIKDRAIVMAFIHRDSVKSLPITDDEFKLPIFKIMMFDEEINGMERLQWIEEELFSK